MGYTRRLSSGAVHNSRLARHQRPQNMDC
jgi:hypothetical protein